MRLLLLAIALSISFAASASQPDTCGLAVAGVATPGPVHAQARRRALSLAGFSQLGSSEFFHRGLVLLKLNPDGALSIFFGEEVDLSVDGVAPIAIAGAAGWFEVGDLVRQDAAKTTWFAPPTQAQLAAYPRSFVVEKADGAVLTLSNGVGTWVIRTGVAEFTAGTFHEGAD